MQDPVDYPGMLASPLGGATGELGQRHDTISLTFSSSSWVPCGGGWIQVGKGEGERPGRRLSQLSKTEVTATKWDIECPEYLALVRAFQLGLCLSTHVHVCVLTHTV